MLQALFADGIISIQVDRLGGGLPHHLGIVPARLLRVRCLVLFLVCRVGAHSTGASMMAAVKTRARLKNMNIAS